MANQHNPRRLYIVRHGETDWNVLKKIQGQTDIPLNERGKEQAMHVADQLQDLGLTHIISSDLSRTMETARIIADALKLPILPHPAFREMRFGGLEGLTKSEILHMHGITEEYWLNPYYDFSSFGGEKADDVKKRLITGLESFFEEHTEAQPLIVSHARTIRTLLHLLIDSFEVPKQGTFTVVEYKKPIQ